MSIGISADVFVCKYGELVRAGIIDERTVICINVFESHPHSGHETLWTAAEVHAVGMEVLLRAHGKIEGLKRESSSAIQVRKQLDDVGVACDLLDLRNCFPSVLDPQVCNSPISPSVPVVSRVKSSDDCVSQT